MKARILIESAALGPDDLKIAFQAFDGAWEKIANRYKGDSATEAARVRLATVVLSLMPDTKDPAELTAISIQELTKGD